MAIGEVGFTTRGRTAKKFTFEPVPKNDYDLKLDCSGLQVDKKQGDPAALPYLGGLKLEIMNTGVDGGSNRVLFHSLFTRITPTEKGNISWDDMKGPQGIIKALGQEVDIPGAAIQSFPEIDKDTKEPTGKTIQLVDPKWLKGYLAQFDGQVVNGHVKIRRQKDQDPKNEVAYFNEAEASGDAFGEEGGDAFDSAAEEVGAAEAEAAFDEPEPTPPPKPATPVRPAMGKKPVPQVKGKNGKR